MYVWKSDWRYNGLSHRFICRKVRDESHHSPYKRRCWQANDTCYLAIRLGIPPRDFAILDGKMAWWCIILHQNTTHQLWAFEFSSACKTAPRYASQVIEKTYMRCFRMVTEILHTADCRTQVGQAPSKRIDAVNITDAIAFNTHMKQTNGGVQKVQEPNRM